MLYKPIKGPAATVACAWCSKGFRPRRGRPAKFCSDRCRQGHFRYARNVGTTDPTAHNETPPKTSTSSKPCKHVFGDRGSADNALFRKILATEGWGGGRPITSADGVRCFVMRERQPRS
jgi:hypothetical protein